MLNKEEVLNRLKGVIYPGFEKDMCLALVL